MAKGWSCRAFYNVNPFIGLSFHDTLMPIPLPPFMAPAMLPHIDFSVMQGLWMGSYLSVGRHKKIVADGLLFLGARSDAGFPIPHISIPPSWFNLLTTLFASSTELFGASSVQIASKNLLWGSWDTSIAATPFGPVPFCLQLACNEAPCCFLLDLSVLWGSVFVGMTLADFLTGLAYMALYIVIDLGGKALGKALGGGVKKIATMFKRTAEDTAEEAAKNVSKDAAQGYLKKAAKLQGIRDALWMSEEDVAKFARKDFTEELAGAAGHLDEGVNQAENLMAKDLAHVSAADYVSWGMKEVEREEKSLAGLSRTEIAALTKRTVLKDALQDLEVAVRAMRRQVVLGTVGGGLVLGTVAAMLGHLVAYGSVFTGGTQGGALSFTSIDLPRLITGGVGHLGAMAAGAAHEVRDGADDYWYAATSGAAEAASDGYDYST